MREDRLAQDTGDLGDGLRALALAPRLALRALGRRATAPLGGHVREHGPQRPHQAAGGDPHRLRGHPDHSGTGSVHAQFADARTFAQDDVVQRPVQVGQALRGHGLRQLGQRGDVRVAGDAKDLPEAARGVDPAVAQVPLRPAGAHQLLGGRRHVQPVAALPGDQQMLAARGHPYLIVDPHRAVRRGHHPLDQGGPLRGTPAQGLGQHVGKRRPRQGRKPLEQRGGATPLRDAALREALGGVVEGRRVPGDVEGVLDPAVVVQERGHQERRNGQGLEHLTGGGRRRQGSGRHGGRRRRCGGTLVLIVVLVVFLAPVLFLVPPRVFVLVLVRLGVLPDPSSLGPQEFPDRLERQVGAGVGHR